MNDAIIQTDQRIVFPGMEVINIKGVIKCYGKIAGSQRPSAASVKTRRVKFEIPDGDSWEDLSVKHAWSQTSFDQHHKGVQVILIR